MRGVHRSLLCAGAGKPMLSLTNRLNFLGVIYFPSEIFLLRTASQTVQRNLCYKGSARSLCVIVDAESASLLCAGGRRETNVGADKTPRASSLLTHSNKKGY